MRRLLIPLLCLLLVPGLHAQKRKPKKEVEPKPQVLEVLPEPPEAVTVETARLTFQVSPLSSEGLLSRQVRDALRALLRNSHGATIVKIRAFVAGSGDLRRIKEIVSKGSKKLTDADYEERDWLEWQAGLYWSEDCGAYIPSDNIERCIQLGAQKSRIGKDVAAAVFFLFSGQVHWSAAAVMAGGALLGGVLGGRLAGRVKPAVQIGRAHV